MKSNTKSNVIIIGILLALLFTLLPIISPNLSYITGDNNKISEYKDRSSNINPKISAVSGKIHIDNNWTAAKAAGICTGNGTFSDPYVLEDLEIDGGSSGTCILIENSNVFFRIKNCTVFNSGDYPFAGIVLNNTNNGLLIENMCSPNYCGVSLYNSHNNTISGNTAINYNNGYGILLRDCDNNTISGNTAGHNSVGVSIHLGGGYNNDITGNILISNFYGIQVWSPGTSNNTIMGNVISHNSVYGIEFKGSTHDNDVYLNCFTKNGLAAYDSGTNNRWDNGTKGNYWDNYTGSEEMELEMSRIILLVLQEVKTTFL